MIKNRLSIIIPDRNGQPYLQKTVDDIFKKAKGDVEVIVVADGVWPDPPLKVQDKLLIIHQGEVHNNPGMREAINKGVALSSGEYIMKTDEHTMFDEGFDVKLIEDAEKDMVVIPRRKRLEPDSWTLILDGRPDIDYMYIEYPFLKPFDKTQGLHGAEWKRPDRAGIMIDGTPTMQGSCYFMSRYWWDKILPNGLDDVNYGTFTQEAQEISMATWFTGGKVMVNKKTWYAHFHKGKKGKGYGFSNEQYKRHMEGTEKGRKFCIDKWLNTKEYKYDFGYFVDILFPSMPGWDGNWRERLEADKHKDYSNLPEDQRPDWFENNAK